MRFVPAIELLAFAIWIAYEVFLARRGVGEDRTPKRIEIIKQIEMMERSPAAEVQYIQPVVEVRYIQPPAPPRQSKKAIIWNGREYQPVDGDKS